MSVPERQQSPYWRSHPWWRLAGAGVALCLCVVATIMWFLHVGGARHVFDLAALVASATAVAWCIFRGHYEGSGKSEISREPDEISTRHNSDQQ